MAHGGGTHEMPDNKTSMNREELTDLARRVQRAARRLARQTSTRKNAALSAIATTLRRRTREILEANARDVERALERGRDDAFVDRLRLDTARIDKMAGDVEAVVALPDPIGRVDSMWLRPNGLKVGKKRIPLGVVAIIYEARPNVTSDAAALCLKSGNGVILKGGSDAIDSNRAIYRALREGLCQAVDPGVADAIGFVDSTERELVGELLRLEKHIDVVIPRGGKGLIRFVHEHSRIPVIKHDEGVCHVVVEGTARPTMVDAIVLNAKTQRPSVCNAAETVLFLENAVEPHLARTLRRLAEAGVHMYLCPRCLEAAAEAGLDPAAFEAAAEEHFHREFLGLELAVRVVDDLDAAVDHIAEYGSRHTEAIVTEDYTLSQHFVDAVDSSCVMVNASTRFADGSQLGLGAEIGISTTRLHAYGPMGIEELTTTKFVVFGEGQVRT